jgi:hypothetical protein
MSTFSIPDQNGNISQPNKGELLGNLYATYGVDLSTEQGRIIASPATKNVFDELDDADFDNPIAAFEFYNSTWWAASDVLFKSASGYPDSAWTQDATASSPSGDWKEIDMEVFNSLLLVSGVGASQDDIYAYNGSTWSSWWKGTLAQTALNATVFKPIKLGATGRLYILDQQNKIYNVTTAGVPTKTGNGTLDFSATTYKFICMEATSTKLWIGGTDIARGSAVIVEWDMSLNSATANKVHKLNGRSVQAIAVWNDNPIALLSNGELHAFNGSYFEMIPDAKLPTPPLGYTFKGELGGASTITTDGGIVHPNGWAIIDGLPHFFLNTKLVNKSGTEKGGHWNAPSGVWCYDPFVGFYCRYPVARDFGTKDYGAPNVTDHGAMTFVGSGAGEFLVSAKIYDSASVTSKAVLLLNDNERSLQSRGWFAVVPFQSTHNDLWQELELLHKKLADSDDTIIVKYRYNKSSALPDEADIVWTSTSTFTATDTMFSNVEVGDEVTVLRGNGAGLVAHVSALSYSNPTYTITLDDTAVGVDVLDSARVLVDNWKKLTTIDSLTTNYDIFSFPNPEDSFKVWIKIELRCGVGSEIELDRLVVNSKNYKK